VKCRDNMKYILLHRNEGGATPPFIHVETFDKPPSIKELKQLKYGAGLPPGKYILMEYRDGKYKMKLYSIIVYFEQEVTGWYRQSLLPWKPKVARVETVKKYKLTYP